MFTRRRRNVEVPEVGAEAPEFNLPSAQGGQLRLSMRTARGPVVVAFFRGAWAEEDVEYFQALSEKEDEINLAGASVVGIGTVEPDEAREFARASGIKSMILYDYARITTRQWGLSERDKEHGDYAKPAVFIVGTDHKVVHAWTEDLPSADEILAKITEITGLPKPPEEEEEKPEETREGEEKPKKMTAEERERIKAERRAAREEGRSVRTGQAGQAAPSEQEQAPKKMSKEERERIKAERRAAREAGKSVKTTRPEGGEAPAASDAPKKMTAEERERIKAERRAAREAGKSLKKPAAEQEKAAEKDAGSEEEAQEG